MYPYIKKLIQKSVNVHDDELLSLIYSFTYFFFLLASYYILRPLRDEMGIRGGIDNLQWLFTGTFLTILVVVPIYAAIISKFSHKKFLPWTYHFFASNIIVFWLLFQLDIYPQWVARAFFVWLSVFNLFIVSIFWSFMAHTFHKGQATRLFGFIAAGGTVGALFGPMVTLLLIKFIGLSLWNEKNRDVFKKVYNELNQNEKDTTNEPPHLKRWGINLES